MMDIEHALDSSNKCSKDDIGKDSGVDPNACTGNGILPITDTPLAEVVWTQNEGLSLRYVASSLGEKEACLLWNTENFNIVISSPKCGKSGNSSNTKDLAEGDLDLSVSKMDLGGETFDCVLAGSSRSTDPGKGGFVVRNDEQESRTARDSILSKKVEDGVHKISTNYQLADKEAEFNTSATHRTVKDVFSDKAGQSAEVLSGNLKEFRPDITQAAIECASEGMKAMYKREVYETSLQPMDRGCFSTKHGNIMHSSSRSKEAEHNFFDLTSDATVGDTNGLMAHGEMKMLDSPPIDPSMHEVSDESLPASCNGKSVCVGSLSDSHFNRSNRDKDKERATSDSTEGSKCTSGDSEDSHNSVESSNSKRLVYISKRGRDYGLEMLVENKRQKKQIDEASSSGTFRSQGGSFMNWVATITNGFSRFSDATPLAMIPPPSQDIEGDLSCLSLSHAKGKDRDTNSGNMGFKSIFQSLYLPGFNSKTGTNVSYPAVSKAAKELDFETEKFGYSERQLHCKKMEFNMQDLLPSKGEKVNGASKYHSCSERLNVSSTRILGDGGTDESCNVVSMPVASLQKDSHQVKDCPSTERNAMAGVSIFRESTECSRRKIVDLDINGSMSSSPKNSYQSPPVGNGVDIIRSISSSPKNSYQSPPVGNGVDIIGSISSSPKNSYQSPPVGNGVGTLRAVGSSSSMSPSNVKKEAFQNLWITRFSPKNSSALPQLPDPERNMEGVNSTTASLTREANVGDATDLKLLNKGKRVLTPPLNPVSHLHEFQKKEPVASTFAKRLEMRRKWELSKIPCSTTCFFCGKSHHSIGECS